MKVFDFLSYKMFLSKYIESSGRRGLISELAKAAGCSHSYLSQVLNGKPDLTLDQAWALTEHLSFKKDEAEYFFLLVLNERAASPTLKKNLETKLKSIKKEQFHTDRAVSATTDEHLQASQRDRYYSNWNVGAVHILTACPSFQKIEDLSKRLNLPALEIEHILNWLIEND
ncbi:MAG: helix-turn-helix domain-containing protein, partial [Bacteriovorax sp.]